ncbi:hypothetical protein HKX48_009288 [Thoreauomyces humboldtii]|nr:hypothetical protein HKX48_009288 [Thoreauomyces humboldtii]
MNFGTPPRKQTVPFHIYLRQRTLPRRTPPPRTPPVVISSSSSSQNPTKRKRPSTCAFLRGTQRPNKLKKVKAERQPDAEVFASPITKYEQVFSLTKVGLPMAPSSPETPTKSPVTRELNAILPEDRIARKEVQAWVRKKVASGTSHPGAMKLSTKLDDAARSVERLRLLVDCDSPIEKVEALRTPFPTSLLELVRPVSTEDKKGRSHVQKMFAESASPGQYGYPKVWCANRQELAEGYALDRRFIQYQSGYQYRLEETPVHGTRRIATAILLAGYNSKGDVFSPYVFITHAGGRSQGVGGTVDNLNYDGRTRALSSSQEETDYNVEALRNAMYEKRDVMVIVAREYGLLSVPAGVSYAVLGNYRITHMWTEKEGDFVRYKLRYELSPEGINGIWHIKPNEKKGRPRPVAEHVCTECGEASPRIYRKPICFRSVCALFGLVAKQGVFVAPREVMKVRKKVLRQSLQDSRIKSEDNSIVPLQATMSQMQRTSACMWCPSCGRLSRRTHANKWECAACDACIPINLPTFQAHEVAGVAAAPLERFGNLSFALNSGIRAYLSYRQERFVVIYILPTGGEIHHQLAPATGDPIADQVYLGLQKADLDFRRLPVKSRIRDMVTSNYLCNAGEAYDQASALEARSLEKSTAVEMKALEILQNAAKDFKTTFNQSHKNLSLCDDRQ